MEARYFQCPFLFLKFLSAERDRWAQVVRSQVLDQRSNSMYSLPGLPLQSTTNSRIALSPGSGGWKSEIKVSAGLVPSEGFEGGSAAGLSPSFR